MKFQLQLQLVAFLQPNYKKKQIAVVVSTCLVCAHGTPGGQIQPNRPLDGVGKKSGVSRNGVGLGMHVLTQFTHSTVLSAWNIPRTDKIIQGWLIKNSGHITGESDDVIPPPHYYQVTDHI